MATAGHHTGRAVASYKTFSSLAPAVAALHHAAKTLAHNLGAVDYRDKRVLVDLANKAPELHGLAPA